MNKKQFALAAIRPYYQDPSICGYNTIEGCTYYTHDGKMCVLGKFLLNPQAAARLGGTSDRILAGRDQKDILKPEAVGILEDHEWRRLQIIHDRIAQESDADNISNGCKLLGLFTYEELIAPESQSVSITGTKPSHILIITIAIVLTIIAIATIF